jgi:hypothetical protein
MRVKIGRALLGFACRTDVPGVDRRVDESLVLVAGAVSMINCVGAALDGGVWWLAMCDAGSWC